jgi:hypothetical protein
MASAPARPGAEGIVVVNLQAHLRSQLRFIRGNLARLERSASKGWLTADESRELSFCERMLGAVRPFKNADTDLQNAQLFWEVHDLLLAVGEKRVEPERGCGARGAGGKRGARGAARGAAPEAAPEAGADEDEKTERELNARFQSMGPCRAGTQ